MPTFDGGNDLIGVGFPDEWLCLLIVLFDKALDGSLQIDDGMKDTVLQPSSGEFCEEALDSVEP